MSEKIAVTPLAFWKRHHEFQDPPPEINRQGEDRTQLDHDRVHFPEAIVQIEMQHRLDQTQMRS